MRPPNTNPYRLWSCLSVLPNLGNRQRDGQELRREGKRQRDTYEERVRRGVEGTKVPQLRRCVDTSMKVSSEQAVASLAVSCLHAQSEEYCLQRLSKHTV